jgi:hypothetical protein
MEHLAHVPRLKWFHKHKKDGLKYISQILELKNKFLRRRRRRKEIDL